MTIVHRHTPGPWRPVLVVRKSKMVIASEHTDIAEMGNHIEYIMDAFLIAAAPGLLEACIAACKLLTNPDADAYDADAVTAMLQDAIAKATGV